MPSTFTDLVSLPATITNIIVALPIPAPDYVLWAPPSLFISFFPANITNPVTLVFSAQLQLVSLWTVSAGLQIVFQVIHSRACLPQSLPFLSGAIHVWPPHSQLNKIILLNIPSTRLDGFALGKSVVIQSLGC